MGGKVTEPGLEQKRTFETGSVHFVASRFLESRQQLRLIHHPDGTAEDGLVEVGPARFLACSKILGCLRRDEFLWPAIEDFVGNDANQSIPHHKATPAETDDLFSGNGEQELEKVAIEEGEAHFAKQFRS